MTRKVRAQAQVFKIHSLVYLQKIFSLRKGLSKAYFCQMSEEKEKKRYRGRLAPTPSGYLHEGHAILFALLGKRTVSHCGVLVYRNDDLDPLRCREEFTQFGHGGLEVLWANLVRGSGLRRQVRTV